MADNKEKAEVFYAACIPQQDRLTHRSFNLEHFISKDKNEILKLIKRYRGSRFKSFSQYNEALKFVINFEYNVEHNDSVGGHGTPEPPVLEEPAPYPSLDIRDLNLFKRAIINRQLDAIKKFVYMNPHYLISNYFDSPTIIAQGARYNAVHLSIRSRCPDILNFVLETINSLDFVKKVNPNVNEESLMAKRDHILDMYLNSPDKVNFDTPLHMACKLGDLECVSILVSYIPVLDTLKLNKQNHLPYQVVKDSVLRNKVHELINSSVFITVTKSNENLDKTISKACHVGRKILESKLKNTNEKVQISAIVGPMTPEKSQKVYEVFKSPKKCTPEQRLIRLQDPNRGLERVVCELSQEFNLPYCEYWSFLNGFVDFCSENDLKKLDDHLRSVHDQLCLKRLFSKLNFNVKKEQISKQEPIENEESEERFLDAIDYCKHDEDNEDIFFTAPTSPDENLSAIDNNNKFMIGHFYINGIEKEKIDHEVYDTIKMALDKQHLLPITNSQSDDQEKLRKYPFLNRWFQNIKNSEIFV